MSAEVKYHVNPETGNVGQCGAQIRCPFKENGQTAPHFSTEAEADAHRDKIMAKKHGITAKVSRKPRKVVILPEETKAWSKSSSDLVWVGGKRAEGKFDVGESVTTMEGTVYEGWRGSKADTPLKEVTRGIREDLKKATAQGYLPKNVSYSVRRNDYGVHVEIRGLEDHRIRDFNIQRTPLHKDYRRILDTVYSIVNSYNSDNSNPQIDYFSRRFGTEVKIRTKSSQLYQVEETLMKEAKSEIVDRTKRGKVPSLQAVFAEKPELKQRIDFVRHRMSVEREVTKRINDALMENYECDSDQIRAEVEKELGQKYLAENL